MRKIMTVVGTRPELIKMSRVMAELSVHTQHILVHTGQNYDYELNQVFFDDLALAKPNYFLEAQGDNPAQTIARVIEKSYTIMQQEMPDAVLLYGDTNSCMAVIAAKRLKIPVFHMEAGNRCFDQRVPEELNRKVLDHLSDINLVLTEHARRYLLSEGIRPETIFKTGSHLCEVLRFYESKIAQSSILEQLNIKAGQYFVVSIHREENVDYPENLEALRDTLNAIAHHYHFPVIVSTHPRTKKRLNDLPQLILSPLIRFLKPFGFTDYIQLQRQAHCVVSDSGTITEEASLLRFPAITIRQAHERPEGMDSGILIMAGLHTETVLEAIKVTMAQHAKTGENVLTVPDYENPLVSQQIVRIVLSYIDYVNRTVWHKAN